MDLLNEIEKVQRELQISNPRERNLFDYTINLQIRELAKPLKDESFYTDGLLKIIKDTIDRKGKAVWVDLGCGNGVALRDAKLKLEEAGYDPNSLITYGVDILPQNHKLIKEKILLKPKEYSPSLLSKNYAPNFIKHDISSVLLPQNADLITSVHVLQWSNDPLKIFENAYNQLNPEGILILNHTRNIIYSKEITDSYKLLNDSKNLLFNNIYKTKEDKKNVDVLISNEINIMIRKKDYTPFRSDLSLIKKEKCNSGFIHLYN